MEHLTTRAKNRSHLSGAISGILSRLEALPPASVEHRTHEVAVAVVHVLYAIPDAPQTVPAHLLALSQAIRHHRSLAAQLFSMPPPVFHDRVRNLMHAAAGSALGCNGVMMLARAQLGLRCHCELMWQRLEGHKFDRFPPVGVAVVLNAAATATATLAHPAPAPPVLRALAAAFASHCWEDSMTPRAASMCLWALGTFEYVPVRQDTRAWQHALAQHAAGMNAREVSAVWAACSRLQWKPERTAWQQLEQATARELGGDNSFVVWGPRVGRPRAQPASATPDTIGIVSAWVAWGALATIPSAQVEKVMTDALVRELPRMHAWHASMSLRSLAKLSRVHSGGALSAAYARVGQLLGERRSLGAWDSAAVVYSLACIVAARQRGHVGAVGVRERPAPVDAAELTSRGEQSRLVRHMHSILEDDGLVALPSHAEPEHAEHAREFATDGTRVPPLAARAAAELCADSSVTPTGSRAGADRDARASADQTPGWHGGTGDGGRPLQCPGEEPETAGGARSGCAEEVRLARKVLTHAAVLHGKGRPFEQEALRQVRPRASSALLAWGVLSLAPQP